jgi:hypothetical protein
MHFNDYEAKLVHESRLHDLQIKNAHTTTNTRKQPKKKTKGLVTKH